MCYLVSGNQISRGPEPGAGNGAQDDGMRANSAREVAIHQRSCLGGQVGGDGRALAKDDGKNAISAREVAKHQHKE